MNKKNVKKLSTKLHKLRSKTIFATMPKMQVVLDKRKKDPKYPVKED